MPARFGRNTADAVTFPFRRATAPWRAMPDFLVIGAHGSGTSTLYRLLEQHPQIRLTSRKETHCFDQDPRPAQGWYRAHFPLRTTVPRGGRVGDNTPAYLDHPEAARRAHEWLPNADLVVVLRDPVARAFSHFHKAVRHGRETRSFEDAVAAEQTGPPPPIDKAYLGRGEYAHYLTPWIDRFGRDSLTCLWSDDLFTNGPATAGRVVAALGLPPAPLAPEKRNVGGYRATLEPEMRDRLRAHFSTHDDALTRLVGMEVPW